MRQDPKFFRPAEVDLLIGDATKARTKLGWEPEVDFPTLVKMMVAHDLEVEAAQGRRSDPADADRLDRGHGPPERRFRSRAACR